VTAHKCDVREFADHRGTTRKGRGLAMQRPPRITELVFEPVDLPLQLVPLLAIPVAILIGPLMLAAQPLNLVLLSFQLGDQLVARRRAPFRPEHVRLCHASVGSTSGNCGARAAQTAGRRESPANQIPFFKPSHERSPPYS